MTEVTLQLCQPARCDCNRSRGHLALLDRDPGATRADVADVRRIWMADSESGLRCAGDECHMTCRPFDPREVEMFELVGRLRVQVDENGAVSRLLLDDLDVEASRRRVAGRWEPIPTGEFAFPLERPTLAQ